MDKLPIQEDEFGADIVFIVGSTTNCVVISLNPVIENGVQFADQILFLQEEATPVHRLIAGSILILVSFRSAGLKFLSQVDHHAQKHSVRPHRVAKTQVLLEAQSPSFINILFRSDLHFGSTCNSLHSRRDFGLSHQPFSAR